MPRIEITLPTPAPKAKNAQDDRSCHCVGTSTVKNGAPRQNQVTGFDVQVRRLTSMISLAKLEESLFGVVGCVIPRHFLASFI